MKKTIITILILALTFSALFADSTDSSGTTITSTNSAATLSLLIPGDTLTLKFARDASGNDMNDSSKLFTLNKYEPFTGATDITSSDKAPAGYATSAVTFYVYYQALVSKKAKIVIKVPTVFRSTTTEDTIPVQSDSGKINAGSGSDAATILKVKAEENKIVDLDATQIYNGYKKCILALDVTGAKSGITYTGTITMNVVAGS